MMLLKLSVCTLMLWCCAMLARAEPVTRWVFDEGFTVQERDEIKLWLAEVHVGLDRLFGPAPRGYEIHLYPRASAKSPVPWAHTSKGSPMVVHMYVDTRAHTWAQFRADWTAAHELSHMLFPYVGYDRWFSEGLASYLQYQVMYAAGHMTWPRAVARYAERFERVQRSRVPADWSVLEHNNRLHELRDYPRLYWGGAAFFALVDRQLWQRQGIRLNDVVAGYTRCCYRRGGVSGVQVLESFDKVADSTVFRDTYDAVMRGSGTPDTTGLADWLARHPPEITP